MAAENITLRVIYEYRLCLESSTEKIVIWAILSMSCDTEEF